MSSTLAAQQARPHHPLQRLRAALFNPWCWALACAVVVLAAWLDAPGRWTPGPTPWRDLRRLLPYWGAWLLWPALLALGLRLATRWRQRHTLAWPLAWARLLRTLLAMVLATGLLWARFAEPNQLRVLTTPLSQTCGVTVALISDMHLGLYWRTGDLDQVVDRLNTLDIDAVLIAGDFSYDPPTDLQAAYAPLARLRHRRYAVLGNHDEQLPGAPLRVPLLAALKAHGVQVIEAQRVALGRCELAGLGDYSAGVAARDLATLSTSDWSVPVAQRVILTHEPDTAFRLAPLPVGLLLAGHTHGGQINLPWFTSRFMDLISEGDFKRGLYDLPALAGLRVFVTSGLGTDHLPLRFRMPPTVDVLGL